MESFINIMPCLDIRAGRVVKGIQFDDLIDAGDPVTKAVGYEADGADELGFLDISVAMDGTKPNFALLREVTAAVKLPVTMGGGLRSREDVASALAAGAAKVSLATAAFRQPDLVAQLVAEFGREKIVVALDAQYNPQMPSAREVYVGGGKIPTGADAVEFARRMADAGASSFLPTSIPADGSKQGYDVELIRAIADATQRPVIASGGAGLLVHFREAVKQGHASTLLLAGALHFGVFNIPQIKRYLAAENIAVRQPPNPGF